jgi:hypothetical protein
MVGGISQVAMGIQQVQNLGSIWKNADLSGGQRLLQTITNISFSFPMLTRGLSIILKSLHLLNITQEKTVADATAVITAHGAEAVSFGVVGAAASSAGLQVQFFNNILTFSPVTGWIVGITAAVAALGGLVNWLDKANEALQKEAKETVEA